MPHSQRFKKIIDYPVIFWLVYKKKPKVLSVVLSKNPKSSLNYTTPCCLGNNAFISQIAKFLNGADVHFPLSMLRLDLCSVFQQKVLRAVHSIPRGRVSTYQLIAQQIGKPKAVRAVARALATNPFPLILPCHRVIRSDGTLGGYLGGTKMKQALLREEGRL